MKAIPDLVDKDLHRLADVLQQILDQSQDPRLDVITAFFKLEALEVNLEQGTVKVDLSRLYPDIDLAETLSNLTGKWIKRILPDPEDPARPGTVEFADGTTADLKDPDWRLIKPLIWW